MRPMGDLSKSRSRNDASRSGAEASKARSRYIDDGAGGSDEDVIVIDAMESSLRSSRRRSTLPNAVVASPEEMAADERPVAPTMLMRALRTSSIEDTPLGVVCACTLDALGVRSHTQTLLLLASWGMLDRLHSHDFVRSLGTARLKSKQLVRLVFRTKEQPSDVIAELAALAASGALNIHSVSALAAIHAGMRRWASVETHVALVRALIDEFDTYDDFGSFMVAYLDCDACHMSLDDKHELLGAVLELPHVKDCAGEARDLRDHLVGYERVVAPFIARVGAPDVDEDARGNLTGFITYSSDDDDGVESSISDTMDEEELLESVRRTPVPSAVATMRAATAHAGQRRRRQSETSELLAELDLPPAAVPVRKRLRRSDGLR